MQSSDSRKRMKRKRAMSQYDWTKKHLELLWKLKDRYLEEDAAAPQDAKYGFWSARKLIAINYLIPQFGKLALKGNFTHCFYLDLFAGSGLVKLESDIVVPGSAMVALAADTPNQNFEKYYFVENDPDKAAFLDNRLSRIRDEFKRDYEVKVNDCNIVLPEILTKIYEKDPDHCCFLALVDPEGYGETGWDTVKLLLGGGKGDMIFNFTEGVARNVEKARAYASYIPLLEKFFGEPKDNWLHLNSYNELVEHFLLKFRDVNEIKRLTFRIDVTNDRNSPLYGLLIATGSGGYANIVRALKRRLDATEVSVMRNIWLEFEGKSKPITSWMK